MGVGSAGLRFIQEIISEKKSSLRHPIAVHNTGACVSFDRTQWTS